MVHRKLESIILQMLESFRIVAINGPRQSGKTTLQKRIAKEKRMEYYTFDKSETYNVASSNPDDFITYISKDKNVAIGIHFTSKHELPKILRLLKMYNWIKLTILINY